MTDYGIFFRGGGIEEALEQLEEEGRVFRHKWPWSQSIFWYPTGHDLSGLFQPVPGHKGDELIISEESMKPNQEQPAEAQSELDRLRCENEELEARIRELRIQLNEQPETPDPLVYEVFQAPVDYFQTQLEYWQQERDRCLASLRHSEATIAAYQHLLEIHAVPDSQPFDLRAVADAIDSQPRTLEISPKTNGKRTEHPNLPEAS